jgi:hypothetical protein
MYQQVIASTSPVRPQAFLWVEVSAFSREDIPTGSTPSSNVTLTNVTPLTMTWAISSRDMRRSVSPTSKEEECRRAAAEATLEAIPQQVWDLITQKEGERNEDIDNLNVR